jgi:predicted NUDIX family phosphoesterase
MPEETDSQQLPDTDDPPSGKSTMSHLDAAELALRQAGRPMHSKEIARAVAANTQVRLSGATPWKTITARLSMDILRHGDHSRFKRSDHGLFALREWGDGAEFAVKRRHLNPLRETIKAVKRSEFLGYIGDTEYNGLIGKDYVSLINMSDDLSRSTAEQTDDYVQLVPTFIIIQNRSLLSFTRTKRLPEARLHNACCISFGGHLQSEDTPTLFRDDVQVIENFVFRELYEELAFSTEYESAYLGILHLRNNKFERQHAGLVFEIRLPDGSHVQSLEPGMHTDVRFIKVEELLTRKENFDSWSQCLIEVANGRI